jgi:endonuclease/exonuclease/phosphatase family metal-dependent hydrolase
VLLLFLAVRRSAETAEAAPQAGPGISVVTLNMAKETDIEKILGELRARPALRDADVLLLQEVSQAQGERSCVAEHLAARLGLQIAYSPAETGVTDQGLAILSRFPLRDIRTRALPRHDLRFRSRSRIALAATTDSPWGAVRIFNTHLDTRLNPSDRLEQLDPVVRDSAEFAGPRIIGGDFNSNGFRWIGNVLPTPAPGSQAAAVRDFMTRRGFHSASPADEPTFDYLGMHLDWIWLCGLESRASRVYPLPFSDHHAVWSRLELTPPHLQN